jgi:methionyl-tRNA formyltransferase
MRIIFIGSVLFSKITLDTLLELNAKIVGIITKESSSFNSDFVNLSDIAKCHNIPYLITNNVNEQIVLDWVKKLEPEIIFCFGWSSLLKKEILDIPSMGVLGFHPSLLPYNKGRHPIIWAKVLGLNKTGATFFFMDENADSGDILSQVEIPILFEDDANSIYNKVIEASKNQLFHFLPILISKKYKRIPQTNEGNTWRKRNKEDGKIDFRMSTNSILNLIRGLSYPYPGAHCIYNNEEIKIWKAEKGFSKDLHFEPGKVLNLSKNNIEIKTGDSSIIFIDHEFHILPSLDSYIN